MGKAKSVQKFITLVTLSIVLSMISGILEAPFLRVLRKSYGPLIFWITGVLVVGVAWLLNSTPLALFLGSIWMTLGVYEECERKGLGFWFSGTISVLSGSVVGFLGGAGVLVRMGINTQAELLKAIETLTGKIAEINPVVKLDAQTFLYQIPSFVIVCLILALGIGLIFERRVFSWLSITREITASQLKLLEYRVPDIFIWIAMTAFLLTMVSFGGKAIAQVALNVTNVSIVLYFFQGLAVLEVCLISIRAGMFTRILAYIILAGQLLPALAVIGFADYWLDFRKRLQKMKTKNDQAT